MGVSKMIPRPGETPEEWRARRMASLKRRTKTIPAGCQTATDDPRRGAEIVVRLRGVAHNQTAHLYIDGQRWAFCEWASNGRFCIEDNEGLCLEHIEGLEHIAGAAATLKQAVDLATAMIRDGRMPSPEQAKQLREERNAKERQQRDAWEHPERLYEPLADALELWSGNKRSNTYVRLRDELLAIARGAAGHFERIAAIARDELAQQANPRRHAWRRYLAEGESWQAQLEYAEEHLARAKEILRTHARTAIAAE